MKNTYYSINIQARLMKFNIQVNLYIAAEQFCLISKGLFHLTKVPKLRCKVNKTTARESD